MDEPRGRVTAFTALDTAPSLLLEVASLQGLALIQQLEQEVWVHVLWEAQVLQRW